MCIRDSYYIEHTSSTHLGSSKLWNRFAFNKEFMTLKQAYFQEYPKSDYTFRDLLIHGILQLTMFITLRCALHQFLNRDIRRWKLYCNREIAFRKKASHIWAYATCARGKAVFKDQQPAVITEVLDSKQQQSSISCKQCIRGECSHTQLKHMRSH